VGTILAGKLDKSDSLKSIYDKLIFAERGHPAICPLSFESSQFSGSHDQLALAETVHTFKGTQSQEPFASTLATPLIVTPENDTCNSSKSLKSAKCV